MGGACSHNQGQDEKFAKGSDKDVSNGPVKTRGCTDIICLIIFLAHWVVFVGVTLAGFSDGDPVKLYKPRDFRGDYCGVETQWNDGLDLKDQEQLTYTMNVTETVDLIAKQLVCSTAAETELTPLLTAEQQSTYRCACCKDPCPACAGSLPLDDLTSAGAISSTMSGKMGELTGLGSATSLFSASGSNGDFISNVWKEATKYFNAVCLEKCTTPETDISASARTYTYSPAPDVPWKKAWDVLSSNANIAADIRNTVNNQFKFTALPTSLCPYESRYCVPFPGVAFEELSSNYCTFKMAADVVASIGSSAASAYEELGANDLVNSMGNSFGDAVGDFMKTIDVFIIVSFLSLVIGLIFLILLRFVVGCVVWFAIFGVFFLFVASGGFFYVRSSQCVGASLFESGQSTTSAAVTSASSAASGGASDESMTGTGTDYRGVQDKTRSGMTCQAWSSQSPHSHTNTPANHPNSGLTDNYCRNPESAPTIWCFTTDPNRRWELCSPIGVLRPDCPQGYVVNSETWRTALEVFAYIMWGFAFLWLVLVCCLNKQIRLAIKINKVAAMFVYNTPTVVLVPLVQILVGVIWCLLWALAASFLLSQVPSDFGPSNFKDSFATYAEAYGTSDDPGACTDQWPTGFTWKYEGDLDSANDLCSGNKGDITGIVPRCWKCAPPRYVLGYRFAISFFSYLWNAAFLIALGQCTIAGAVAVWFFAPGSEKRSVKSVRTGLWNCFRYHLGSLAFGSFILAVVQFIRYFCKYLEEQARAQKNRVMVIVMKIMQYCLWCIEKCIKFLNKNAYIQIALVGKNFCTSAKNAASLWARNFARFGVVATLGSIIHFLGFVFIMSASTVIGYFILQSMYSDVTPVIPLISYIGVGYLVSVLYMNVFGLAVDSILHCFLATEEMGGAGGDFVPGPLKSFFSDCGVSSSDDSKDAKPIGVVPCQSDG